MATKRDEEEQRNLKALQLLRRRADDLAIKHDEIDSDLQAIKTRVKGMSRSGTPPASFAENQRVHLERMNTRSPMAEPDAEELYGEAEAALPGKMTADDLLTAADRRMRDARIARHVDDFNAKFGLDRWDYAIAGACGLMGAMFDLLCVSPPVKPTMAWTERVDGIFNRGVQQAFNGLLPPEVSAALAEANKIGTADASTIAQLVGAPPRSLNPWNHRLRSLSHDPVLGFLFGVLDMIRGTCTVVGNDGIKILEGKEGPTGTDVFGSLGRMFGHLLSDVNAPSGNGNRGMGLPAPFMGVLRMFNGMPVAGSDFGKQVEYMYVNGYDFRQFVVTSIPALIMEVVMRVSYAAKQVKLANEPLGQALVETLPGRMNPRFRMMLAIGYGCMSGVNAGRMYVTQDIMALSYTAWMALAWNGFHALKWAMLDRHLKLWEGIERDEIDAIARVVNQIDSLKTRVERLPT